MKINKDLIKKLLKKYDHIWLLLYAPIFVTVFDFLEKLISPESNYWVSYTPIDDLIPFNELFVIPYVIWFPYIFLIGAFLFFVDKDAFIRYLWGFIIGFSTAMVFFVILPNGQNLRPAVFPRENFLTDIVEHLYENDTNTNVLPSMHVIGAWIIFFAHLDCKKLRKKSLIIIAAVLAVLTTLSTVFIKQHSFLDVVWGLIWSVVLYFIVYVWMKSAMERKKAKAGKA